MSRHIATATDWEIFPMPAQNDTFTLKRSFTSKAVESLRYGNVPREMEDRWFWYMEGDTLYVHRSWSGNCIYVVEFDFEHELHKVTVNRDVNQYNCDSIEEDQEELNTLLSLWTGSPYDYLVE